MVLEITFYYVKLHILLVGLHKYNIAFLCCRKVHGHKNASYEKLRHQVCGIHWALFATHQPVSTNRPRLALIINNSTEITGFIINKS